MEFRLRVIIGGLLRSFEAGRLERWQHLEVRVLFLLKRPHTYTPGIINGCSGCTPIRLVRFDMFEGR